uniref:Uncharacterized protein n=1 Tax=Ostreococcus mediterraneus TaxID=1486918 RepID=A0A6T5SPU9_9CHLO|mmetsp:Transcript_1570/g.4928  ORF Transcript_1570/g.4928 Transcript_1570/m.4928 type:complete len:556 (+) Transcript_1570:355-2022(+)
MQGSQDEAGGVARMTDESSLRGWFAAYEAAGLGAVDKLQELFADGVELSELCAREAASEGHLRCLQYFREIQVEFTYWTARAAALRGNVECLKYVCENINESLDEILPDIALRGDVACLSVLLDYKCKPNAETAANAAACGHVEFLKRLMDISCPLDENTTLGAVRGNWHKTSSEKRLACLKLAHEHGSPWHDETTKICAIQGLLECLKYAHENGCPLHPDTAKLAANYGNVDVLRYACENGCPEPALNPYQSEDGQCFLQNCLSATPLEFPNPFGSVNFQSPEQKPSISCKDAAIIGDLGQLKLHFNLKTFEDVAVLAATYGQIDCLVFAIEHGDTSNPSTMMQAALQNGHLHCVKVIYAHFGEWNKEDTHICAEYGKIECLRYLHKMCCPWHPSTTLAAVENGHIDCLKFAVEHGCEIHSKTANGAARTGDLASLKYVQAHGAHIDHEVMITAARYGSLSCLRFGNGVGFPWDEDLFRAEFFDFCETIQDYIKEVNVNAAPKSRRHHLRTAMQLLDEHAQSIPEGAYLALCNALGGAFSQSDDPDSRPTSFRE